MLVWLLLSGHFFFFFELQSLELERATVGHPTPGVRADQCVTYSLDRTAGVSSGLRPKLHYNELSLWMALRSPDGAQGVKLPLANTFNNLGPFVAFRTAAEAAKAALCKIKDVTRSRTRKIYWTYARQRLNNWIETIGSGEIPHIVSSTRFFSFFYKQSTCLRSIHKTCNNRPHVAYFFISSDFPSIDPSKAGWDSKSSRIAVSWYMRDASSCILRGNFGPCCSKWAPEWRGWFRGGKKGSCTKPICHIVPLFGWRRMLILHQMINLDGIPRGRVHMCNNLGEGTFNGFGINLF